MRIPEYKRRLTSAVLSDAGAGAVRLVALLIIILAIVAVISKADFSGSDPQSKFAKQITDSVGQAFSGIIPKRPQRPPAQSTAPQKQEQRDLASIAEALSKIGTKESKTEASSEQGVVRYTDAAGQTHYVDHVSKVPEQYRKTVDPEHRLPRITKTEAALAKPNPASAPPARPKREKIQVFVTSWCPYCRKLEQMLKAEGVGYTRFDIENDPRGAELHEALGGGGVPLTKIGDKVIRGYSPAAIREALR